MKLLLILALVGILIVAVLMALRGGGPRITTIEHRRETTDEPEDGDDA